MYLSVLFETVEGVIKTFCDGVEVAETGVTVSDEVAETGVTESDEVAETGVCVALLVGVEEAEDIKSVSSTRTNMHGMFPVPGLKF